MRQPRFLSLFAGIGGFDLGFERAGMRCAGQVEIWPFAQRVLAHHWPTVPRHDDVRTASDWWASLGNPAVDVVCGGFPCHNLSVANSGSADSRRDGLIHRENGSGLYWNALQVARQARPRFVVLENVPGLLSANAGADLAAVVRSMADVGYPYVEWRVLDSNGFGVAQRRRRVFVVAADRDPRCGPLLVEPEERDGHPAAQRGPRRAAAGGPVGVPAPDGAWPDREGAAAAPHADGVGAPPGLPRRVDRRGPWVKRGAMNTATEGVETWSSAVEENLPHRTLNTIDWGDARTPALVAGTTGACSCCPVDRGSDADRYGSLGNAVSPPVAAWIGRRLMREMLAA